MRAGTFTEKAGGALKVDEMQVKADMHKFKDFIDRALPKRVPGVEKSRRAARPGSQKQIRIS